MRRDVRGRCGSCRYDIAVMDCLEHMDTMRDGSVQLVVTSSPYNLGKEYERRVGLAEYVEGQRRVIEKCAQKVRDSGSLCWQVGNYVRGGRIVPLDYVLYPVFAGLGLALRNRIVWRFGHGLHNRRRLSGRHEVLMWFTKSDGYVFNLDAVRIPQKYPNKRHWKGKSKGEPSCNPLGKNPSDVWDMPNVKHNHPEKMGHPAQFPEELVRRLVLALPNPSDTVLDPFAGSGTTCAVEERWRRRHVGIEISAEYCGIARRRLAAVQLTLEASS